VSPSVACLSSSKASNSKLSITTFLELTVLSEKIFFGKTDLKTRNAAMETAKIVND
jgi:hypothetical protein